jgi:ATP-dependent Clp protease ATP-binding subunit ClpA
MNKEPALSSVAGLAIAEAQNAGCRTVRPEHMLLALTSTESFFALQLSEAGLEKEILAQSMNNVDQQEANQETMMDKVQCALFNWLGTRMPPYSTAFYHILKYARRRSRSMNRQVISSADLCYALLLDQPDNSIVHEGLKRLGFDPRMLKLALESSDSIGA